MHWILHASLARTGMTRPSPCTEEREFSCRDDLVEVDFNFEQDVASSIMLQPRCDKSICHQSKEQQSSDGLRTLKSRSVSHQNLSAGRNKNTRVASHHPEFLNLIMRTTEVSVKAPVKTLGILTWCCFDRRLREDPDSCCVLSEPVCVVRIDGTSAHHRAQTTRDHE